MAEVISQTYLKVLPQKSPQGPRGEGQTTVWNLVWKTLMHLFSEVHKHSFGLTKFGSQMHLLSSDCKWDWTWLLLMLFEISQIDSPEAHFTCHQRMVVSQLYLFQKHLGESEERSESVHQDYHFLDQNVILPTSIKSEGAPRKHDCFRRILRCCLTFLSFWICRCDFTK